MDSLINLYKNRITEYDKEIAKTKDKEIKKKLKNNRQIIVEQYNKLKKNTYELV
tara:strand:+ start:305 stop:466 length:162 start_codon:yes stop_codon:yes gene_type:complete